MQDVTIYVTQNGRRIKRLSTCRGLRRCLMGISTKNTEDIASRGVLELGWRWQSEGRPMGEWVDGIVVLNYWEGMDTILTLFKTYVILQPAILSKRTDE